MENLKIIFAGNTTLIGRWEEGAYLRKGTLYNPRTIAFGVDPQNRPIIGMQILVGSPDSIEVINPSLMYDVKDEVIVNLYIKSTTNIDIAKSFNNVRSIKSRNN